MAPNLTEPLWELYADHFMRFGADPNGPPPDAIAATLSRVGHEAVELDEAMVRLARPGTAITPNGIGQGYVTDRVVERLRSGGVEHALVDMGETRAIGGYPGGGPWRIGLEDPAAPGEWAERVALVDRAIATSGGYGTYLDPAGRFNHLFEPQTGRTSWRYRSVSVIAENATMADALSTAFSLMPLDQTHRLVDKLGIEAHFVLPGGKRVIQRP
jgi:FAD:protein FMN transferase